LRKTICNVSIKAQISFLVYMHTSTKGMKGSRKKNKADVGKNDRKATKFSSHLHFSKEKFLFYFTEEFFEKSNKVESKGISFVVHFLGAFYFQNIAELNFSGEPFLPTSSCKLWWFLKKEIIKPDENP